MLYVHLPVADDVVVKFDGYFVPTDVALHIGQDVLRKLELLINFLDGTLCSEHDD